MSSTSSQGSTSSTSSRTTKASTLSIGKMSHTSRNRATSIASSIGGQCPECRDKRKDDLGLKVNTGALLTVASNLRDGKSVTLGKKTSGGTNYLLELVFEDGISWLARIPKPWRSSNINSIISSEVAAYRYLKKNTRIPVPEVYHFAKDTDSDNPVGITYMLLERLPGHTVPQLKDSDTTTAKNFHDQLSDIILELSSIQFDKIGSLEQSSTDPDEFTVGPLFHAYNTYPLPRGRTEYNRGPYTSISEYYEAFTDLNIKDTKSHYRPSNPDIVTPIDEELGRFYLLNKMIPRFAQETGFNNGPFVFQNWGLSSQNILVDDECNITGIIEVTGVIGPLPNLCRYPDLIYETSKEGPLFDRKLFLESFLNREIPSHISSSSPLESKETRSKMMRTAHKIWQFENSILSPVHKHLNLRGKGGLYEYAFSDSKFDEKQEFKRLGNSDNEFQLLIPRLELRGGQYSWEQSHKKRQKRRRSSTATSSKSNSTAKKVWEKAPWVKSRREEVWVREYVRAHHHLPPQVAAYNGRRRSNGPEKMFYMAWAFVRCRDASYMKKKNDRNRKKTVIRTRSIGRARMNSVRERTGRVRGWSIGTNTSSPANKGKGRVPPVVIEENTDKEKVTGWKRVLGGLSFSK